jgi:hypothetical protein
MVRQSISEFDPERGRIRFDPCSKERPRSASSVIRRQVVRSVELGYTIGVETICDWGVCFMSTLRNYDEWSMSRQVGHLISSRHHFEVCAAKFFFFFSLRWCRLANRNLVLLRGISLYSSIGRLLRIARITMDRPNNLMDEAFDRKTVFLTGATGMLGTASVVKITLHTTIP